MFRLRHSALRPLLRDTAASAWASARAANPTTTRTAARAATAATARPAQADGGMAEKPTATLRKAKAKAKAKATATATATVTTRKRAAPKAAASATIATPATPVDAAATTAAAESNQVAADGRKKVGRVMVGRKKAPVGKEVQMRPPSPTSPSLNTSAGGSSLKEMEIEGIRVTQGPDGYYSMKSEDMDKRSTYRLLCSAVVPRPTAWVSTMSPDGISNLAPMSFFMPVTSDPPTIAWSQTVKHNGKEKDTLVNIRATGEFTVNHVSGDMFGKMYGSSKEISSDLDEFDEFGVTKLPSVTVKPYRVGNARIQMECKLLNIVPVGEGGYGSSSIVIGRVVRWHVQPHCAMIKVDSDGSSRFDLDADSLGTIGRLGGMEYWQAPYKFSDANVWNDKYW